MGKKQQYTRWDTPGSDARSLVMVSLVDRGELCVTVVDMQTPDELLDFRFVSVAAYRNILEEYRLTEGLDVPSTGWTVIVNNSEWLEQLEDVEDLFRDEQKGSVHYMIITEDDVIDILSSRLPEITKRPPAAHEINIRGKSVILHHPEDAEEIRKVLDGVGRGDG